MAKAASKLNSHRWSFYRSGGVDQVRLDTGADILALDQLDQKLWVALSCPVSGLEIDSRTLALLDSDNDDHVRPPEIIAAARWLREVVKSADDVAKGTDGVQLANIRQDTDEGKALLASARHTLRTLGKEAAVVTVEDTLKVVDAAAKARHNGDGVVPPATLDDDAARAVALDIIATMGGVIDRSGDVGIDKDTLDTFFAACTDFDAWYQAAEADAKNVLPFGEATHTAYASFWAVKGKIDDFFGRCRIAAFDPRALATMNFEQQVYITAAARDMTISADEIANLPLAMVEADKPLPLAKGLNPAWSGRMAAFRVTCCKDAEQLTEADWAALCAQLAGYAGWVATKAGARVEALGLKRVRTILDSKTKKALKHALADDLAVAPEYDAMARVEKLARLHRDFALLLRNYVNFSDFYARRGAIFQAGTLYLDGRACDMSFHVADAAKHAKMAPMSNAYLAYVDCTRKDVGRMSIACAFTAGDSDNLFEGRNGLFYDRKGRDWDATITKIISNPISVRQAFFSPYKKVLRGIQEAVARRAAEADIAATGKLATGVQSIGSAATIGSLPPKPKFEVGTVAALGVAVGGITAAFSALFTGFLGLGAWIPLGIIGIFLAISGPSMFIAWLKLRTRNLGPILDANGWAVNTLTRVNVPLGGSLTELPVIPPGSNRSLVDPYAPKRSPWPRILATMFVLAALGYGLYRTNLLHKWLPKYVPAHHTDLDLSADKSSGAPGDVITLTVRSMATELQVTDSTDRNQPIPLAAIPVASGSATLTIPAGTPAGQLTVRDAVSGADVKIDVTEPKAP